MTYPALPFQNHTWRISHHQGILTPTVLNALLFAASTYQDSRDPTQEINNYLVTNGIVPPNIREDSQQADVWRDYQQLLPELGLIPSTRGTPKIRLSPVGLSFLDGGIGFTDLMTIQAFRWQYPNGHNIQRSKGDTSSISFAEQQAAAGILIKPAALLWQVLDALATTTEPARLSAAEIEFFLIPAKTHDDVPLIVEAIRHNREIRSTVSSGQTKQRRNASDWMKRLSQTHAFHLNAEDHISLSAFSIRNLDHLRSLMTDITRPEAFWFETSDDSQSTTWSHWYGTFDAQAYPIPYTEAVDDYGSASEPDSEENEHIRAMQVRPFQWQTTEAATTNDSGTISSLYSADLSNSAHRLHDTMVRLIAETCHRKHASVFSDPATLDLLIELEDKELLIEAKSATARNLSHKIRAALGQITYYDYLRSHQTTKLRRRGIALTIGIQEDHWSKDFLTDYLDVDLISLRDGRLFTYSRSTQVSELIS
jgi:hypothetical protein